MFERIRKTYSDFTSLATVRWSGFLAIVSFLIILGVVYSFRPGLMSPDSLGQYKQALHPSILHDWHPPSFALLWAALMRATGSISSMLFFQTAMYWAAVYILGMALHRSTKQKVASVVPYLFFGFVPPAVLLSYTLWKDVHVAIALLLSSAAIVSVSTMSRKHVLKHRWLILTIVILPITYASSLRHGVPFMVIPLIWVVLLQTFPTMKLRKRAIFAAGFIPLFFVFGQLLVIASSAERSNVQAAVMLDDINHLADRDSVIESDLSRRSKDYVLSIIGACEGFDHSNNSLFACGVSADEFRAMAQDDYDAVKDLWLDEIKESPISYIKFRIKSFFALLSPVSIYAYHEERITPNEFSLVAQSNTAFDLADDYYDLSVRDYGFLYRPYFWIVVSVVLLCAIMSNVIKTRYKKEMVAVLLSGLIYVMQFIPVTIAYDYRYTYWLTLSVVLVGSIVFAERVDVGILLKKVRSIKNGR